jgi:hypothetical protein
MIIKDNYELVSLLIIYLSFNVSLCVSVYTVSYSPLPLNKKASGPCRGLRLPLGKHWYIGAIKSPFGIHIPDTDET